MADAKPTEEQIAEYRKEFDSFDKNNDGTITVEDLSGSKFEIGAAMWKDMISVLDANRNGKIDFDEYVTWMEATKKSARFLADMKELDKDGNGFISADEYFKSLEQWGVTKEQAEDQIKKMDKNGDGQVSSEEVAVYLFKTRVLKQY